MPKVTATVPDARGAKRAARASDAAGDAPGANRVARASPAASDARGAKRGARASDAAGDTPDPKRPAQASAGASDVAAQRVDGRRERGRQTRASILATAVDIASVEGLEGLTIGRLASELGMSKSGLFAHFGSKEELQLATIDAARDIFVEQVVEPALAAERGLPRLRALLDAKLAYLRGEVFRGGCFFDAARAEYDGREPGPVRDAIAQQMRDWTDLVVRAIRSAQKAGHLDPNIEPEQLVFELDALHTAANVTYQLQRDTAVFDRVERAIEDRLRGLTLTR